jgi:A118 family predicted phage portal protein
MAQWSAWYSNDLAALQLAYGGGIMADDTGFFASDKGGFRPSASRRLVRWFVGQKALGPERNTKLPIPLASEMASASADLLFSDPPTFIINDVKTQARLDGMADDRLFSTFAQAAEICAALGGVYLKVMWDEKTSPTAPFVTVIDADQALPEFMWGRLSAVTFWQTVATEGETVWRHLERHETDASGNGVIIHGLYQGSGVVLGTRVSLRDRTETAPLAVMTKDSPVVGQISSESAGLCVAYVPNQTPNRQWRNDVNTRYLGRSDYDGIEHLLDQLSEVASSLVRAIRLGKARVMIDKTLLQNPGPGQGAVFNEDQEVFTAVEKITAAPGNSGLSDRMQLLQPQIPTQPYIDTINALTEQILQMAGYSMQTFGVGDTGTVRTATEIESRERRSLMTRSRKIRNWIPGLRDVLTKLLAVDNAIFGAHNSVLPIYVEFPDSVQETQLALAQTVQTLFAGESASLHERVTIMHPDWTDQQVVVEVDLIRSETAIQDPTMLPAQQPKIPEIGKPGGPSAT